MVESANTGVGSIWNKNSWHWEEKNYTQFAKKWLTENLSQVKIEKNDISIRIYEMKEIKGEASVSIRK